VSSAIKAVYPFAERANKVEVGIQLARVDPHFPPATREFSQRSLAFVSAYVVVSHVEIGVVAYVAYPMLSQDFGGECIRIYSLTTQHGSPCKYGNYVHNPMYAVAPNV